MISSVTRSLLRAPVVARSNVLIRPVAMTSLRRYAAAENAPHAHESESFDAFNERYRTFFASCTDLFELQRGLNNCFAYDLVPTTEVIDAALRAARKCNDYATAVRILEGVKEKVENKGQYKAYLEELSPVIKELGIASKEELYGTKL
ncbi:cytochrome-c oxidase chain VI precursor [Dioszegia hungarica]|uniref:Cytochrome c oxidase subunit 6, mitochondrial n=1 Tax=Dioszegia hungarica TaxID=4972 RepID=A0AA38LVL2_9TREE|nr:cytochrome-c oxidase chain VI precursor [Dioszegia hungarica]KAI9638067.1 cytochrome-c oxidase chain VI precursor [Dioszegia hungarica]